LHSKWTRWAGRQPACPARSASILMSGRAAVFILFPKEDAALPCAFPDVHPLKT